MAGPHRPSIDVIGGSRQVGTRYGSPVYTCAAYDVYRRKCDKLAWRGGSNSVDHLNATVKLDKVVR